MLNEADLRELNRRGNLILDLAGEEIECRRHGINDGHADEGEAQRVHDLEQDLCLLRPFLQALPELIRLQQSAITSWPQFDDDTNVNGGDLVEWFARWRHDVHTLIEKLTNTSRGA